MKEFLYGEDGQLHKLVAPLFIAGEPVHFQGIHWAAPLKVFVSDTYKAVGITSGLENPPRCLKFAPIEKLIALAVELDLFVPRQSMERNVRGLDEGFTCELIESFFIHT